MARSTASVVALLLLLVANQAFAYPALFLGGETTPSCGLPGPIEKKGPHLAPVVDSGLTFTVTKVGGGVVKATDVLSPGESYTVKASWANPMQGLLTASIGKFSEASFSTCKLAVATTTPKKPSGPVTSITATWSLPCGIESGKVTFFATHSYPGAAFWQNSVTYSFSKGATSPLCATVSSGGKGGNSTASSAGSKANSTSGHHMRRHHVRKAKKLFSLF